MPLFKGGIMIRSWVSPQRQICDTIYSARAIAKALEEWQFGRLPRGYWISKDSRGIPYLLLQDEGFLVGMDLGFERECHYTGWHNINIWQAKWLKDDLSSGWLKETLKFLEQKRDHWLNLVYPTPGINYSEIYSRNWFWSPIRHQWDAPFEPETADNCTYWYYAGRIDLNLHCGCTACQSLVAVEKCIENLKREFDL